MKSKKAMIIIIVSAAVIIAASIVLPGLIWKGHIKSISGQAESVMYAGDTSGKGLTQEKFAQKYVTDGIGNNWYDSVKSSELLRETQDVILGFIENADVQTQKTLSEIINVSNLVSYDSSTQIINTDAGVSAIKINNVILESVGNNTVGIIIVYESKTKVIMNLQICVENPDDSVLVNKGELFRCAEEYYSGLGLSADFYYVYEDVVDESYIFAAGLNPGNVMTVYDTVEYE